MANKQSFSIVDIIIPDRDLVQFGNYLRKNLRINIDFLKKSHVLRRVKSRMLKVGCNNIFEYLDYIKSNEFEKHEIKTAFSINVTHLFRNQDTFEELRKTILPKLKQPRINIWSAGCADGAEPYTIAMILARLNRNTSNSKILATDYNPNSLAFAKKRTYPKDYLKETPDFYLKYISYHDETIKINANLQTYIDFKIHDLLNESLHPKIGKNNFDIILCRNVMIYFDKKYQDLVYKKFYEALKPNGYLIIGRSEIILGTWKQNFETINPKHRIYQKLTN